MAVRFRIPLVVWGENSAFEYGTAEEAHTGFELDGEWLKTLRRDARHDGRRLGRRGADREGADALFRPSDEELEPRPACAPCSSATTCPGTRRRPTAWPRAHGFREDEAPRPAIYDYADIDDDFISIHHWMKWYKFGFTRLFDNLSLEIRNGRITRAAAIEILRRRGDETPHGTSRSSAASPASPRRLSFEIAERSATRTSGSAARTAPGRFRTS